MINRICLLVAGTALGFTMLCAQQKFIFDAEAEKTFSLGLREYSENKFDESAGRFDMLRKARPLHQRTTAAYCMSAKAYFQLKEYKLSYAVAQEFLVAFPVSSYRPDAQYIAALNLMMFQKYQESLRYLLQASEHVADTVLAGQISSMISTVGGERISVAEKAAMYSAESAYYPRSFLALLIAEDYARKGEQARSREYLEKVVVADSSGQLGRRASAFRLRMSSGARLKIGALLPRREGPAKQVADEILEGMEFAVAEFRLRVPHSPQISLDVRESDRDSGEVRQPIEEFIQDKDVVAVVGPLFSNLAFEAAPIASKAGLPMISPTATANGIAGTGSCIFQLHPDFETRGRAMAKYAVQNLGYTKLAVLTSSDARAKAVAAAFASEAVKLGASVVANQTYGQDTTDLREPLIAIRRAGIDAEPRISFAGRITKDMISAMQRAGADPAVLSSARRLNEAVEVTKLLGPNGLRIADSLHLPVIPPQDQPAALEIPATTIDGLFVSVTGGEELGVVAPQISYFNIKTQLMGSAEWNDAQALEANKRYVNDAIFIADSYVDKSDSAYIEFDRAFVLTSSKEPTKNTVLGYDTMTLIAGLIAQGAATRGALATALGTVDGYQGMHLTITLGHGRVNTNVDILKYHHGEVNKIWEITVK